MASRKKRAEALAIAPEGAISALGQNYFRTKNQNPSAKNHVVVADRVIIGVREKGFVDVADLMRTGIEPALNPPTMPRKTWKAIKQRKRKKKRGPRVKLDSSIEAIGINTTVFSSPIGIGKGPPPGPPPSFKKSVVKEEDQDDPYDQSDSDSSFDSEVEDAKYEYEVALDKYKDEKDEYKKRKEKIREGKPYARDLLLAQCTREMKERLKATDDYGRIIEESDVIALLKIIKACGLDYSEDGYIVYNAVRCLKDVLTYTQQREQSNQDFRDELDARLLKLKQIGGDLGRLFELNDEEYSKLPKGELEERLMAVLIIDQSCEERFSKFKTDRLEDAHLGRNDYPPTIHRASIALENHCSDVLKPKARVGGGRDDQTTPSSFAQVDFLKATDGSNAIPGKDGGIFPSVNCHSCKKYGHYKSSCPSGKKTEKDGKSKEDDDDDSIGQNHFCADLWEEDPEERDPEKEYAGENGHFNMATFSNPKVGFNCFTFSMGGDYCFAGGKLKMIDGRLLILLDTGATHHVFCNSALLRSIGPASRPRTLTTNAGKIHAGSSGTFPGIGEVYYDPNSVINVLSFDVLEDSPNFDVSYHKEGKYFSVKCVKSGKVLVFRKKFGIYVIQLDAAALYHT
jgi:hypothetical protein